MSDFIKLSIVTPEKKLFEGEIQQLTIETVEGKRTILPLHSPFIFMLIPSISEFVDSKGEGKKFFSSSGILKVKTKEITMVCDAAEWPEDIDKFRAEEAKKRAESRLKEGTSIDVRRAEMSLLRAIKRNELINKKSKERE
jgi:F-type H+-transporting ATPase subunit epsilon